MFEVCFQTYLYLVTKYLFLLLSSDQPTVIGTVFLSGPSRSWCASMPVHRTGQSLASLRGHRGKNRKTMTRQREVILEKPISKKTCLPLYTHYTKMIALKYYLDEVTLLLKNHNGSSIFVG